MLVCAAEVILVFEECKHPIKDIVSVAVFAEFNKAGLVGGGDISKDVIMGKLNGISNERRGGRVGRRSGCRWGIGQQIVAEVDKHDVEMGLKALGSLSGEEVMLGSECNMWGGRGGQVYKLGGRETSRALDISVRGGDNYQLFASVCSAPSAFSCLEIITRSRSTAPRTRSLRSTPPSLRASAAGEYFFFDDFVFGF